MRLPIQLWTLDISSRRHLVVLDYGITQRANYLKMYRFLRAEVERTVETGSPAVFKIIVYNYFNEHIGDGSGFFIDHNGLALTANHVINKGNNFIAIVDNKSYIIKVIATDSDKDIALVKIDLSYKNKCIYIRRTPVKIGEDVISFGFPKELFNVSTGIVSGIHEIYDQFYIFTTAPISCGSSGGALTDINGMLVGITVSNVNNAQNMNIVVRSEDILEFLNKKII